MRKPDRERILAFTPPCFASPAVLVVRRDHQGPERVGDTGDALVAVGRGHAAVLRMRRSCYGAFPPHPGGRARLSPRSLAPLLALCLALPAAAHEVSAEVDRGQAVAVRARGHDGEGLAGAEVEVFSPADPATPSWKGRTDRRGWVAFVPDAPGRWRVRIVDATGHGIVTDVDVPAPGAADARHAPPPGPSAVAALARPLAGVVLVAVIFGFLFLRGRKTDR